MKASSSPMRSFGSDNHSGVHPKILEALVAINQGHAHSYGEDPLSHQLEKEIQRLMPLAHKTFLVFNGTAANVLALKVALKSHQACLCSEVSHLNLDECAAPERVAGRKLIPRPSHDGKLRPEDLEESIIRRGDQHFAQVRMLSITQPTELGTAYSLEELKDLREFCSRHKLMLHIDGARWANAACFLGVSWEQMLQAADPDLLSLGGTKNGLMGAEALIVFERARELAEDLRYQRKQLLQLPSKTRFLAAQMLAYLRDDLYLEIAHWSLDRAQELEQAISGIEGLHLQYPVQSNALFVQFPKTWTKALRQKYFFYIWDEQQWVARWMTSFDTTSEDIHNFAQELRQQSQKERSL